MRKEMSEEVYKKNLHRDCLKNLIEPSFQEGIHERASSWFQSSNEVNHEQLESDLNRAEELLQDLRVIKEAVEPCFPPRYEVFDKYKGAYTDVIHKKLEDYRRNIVAISQKEPQAVLAFSGFFKTFLSLKEELNFEHEEIEVFQYHKDITDQMYIYVNDYTEKVLKEKFNVIYKEHEAQINELLDDYRENWKKQKMCQEPLATTSPEDAYF